MISSQGFYGIQRVAACFCSWDVSFATNLLSEWITLTVRQEMLQVPETQGEDSIVSGIGSPCFNSSKKRFKGREFVAPPCIGAQDQINEGTRTHPEDGSKEA